VDEVLFEEERERLPVALAWCSGTLEVRAPEEGNRTRVEQMNVHLRASSFPDAEVTRLKVGIAAPWDAAAGHLLVVRAHGPDGVRVLHSGTPREVGADYVAVQLFRPPLLRGDSVRVQLEARGGASLAAVQDASAAGKLDDGGLVMVAAACGPENSSYPCAPVLLEVRYDAECAGPGRHSVLVDSLRLSRVTPSDAQLLTDRLAAALRRAYRLGPGDDVLIKSQKFERWLGVSRHHGALRVDYVLRTEKPRAHLNATDLVELARALPVATIVRRAAHPAATLARAGAAVCLLAVGGGALGRLLARAPERSPAHKPEPKSSVDVISMQGVYPKNLKL
jgi:hypothetical protein